MALVQYLALFVALVLALGFAAYIRIASSRMTRSNMEDIRRQDLAIKGIYEPEDRSKS